MSGPRYKAKDDIHAQVVGDSFLLCDGTTQDVFELNETAQRIWELITEGKSLPEMVEILLQEYEAPEEMIRESLEETISELIEQGLLEER